MKENNPKVSVEGRHDKTKQPAGDPDCRLGCKRRHNRQAGPAEGHAPPATPHRNPVAAQGLSVGEFYWGYGSGVVAVPVPGWGEYVLAELTQPFDQPDDSYFFPLMKQVEQRLGRKPRFGAFDAAYDAWYIPMPTFIRRRTPQPLRPFLSRRRAATRPTVASSARRVCHSALPVCQCHSNSPTLIGLSRSSSTSVESMSARWSIRNATAKLVPSTTRTGPRKAAAVRSQCRPGIGARLRYTLDRDSQVYKDLYNRRTAVERINSQAVALGIEEPHLRNGDAIANLNTLIYILVNLRFLQRI